MSKGLRLLGALRESKLREESDSFEGQRADVKAVVEFKKATLVDWTEDRGVSGREVGPFDRDDLGKWLNSRAHEFDGIAAQKMDRLTRRAIHFHQLIEWCKANNKVIITRLDGIDTSTKAGRQQAELMAMVAAWEWEAIQERNADSHERARNAGKWHGGNAMPYGYRKTGSKGNWTLEPHPEHAEVVRRIVSLFIGGMSYEGIADLLTAENVAPPKKAWRGGGIRDLLRSSTIIGRAVHEGKEVLSDDGLPLQRAEPLITLAEWQQVRKVADARAKKPVERPRANRSPWLGVIICRVCEKRMYAQSSSHGGRARFQCRTKECPVKTIAQDVALSVIGVLIDGIRNLERLEETVIPGVDYSAEIEDIKSRIARLRRQDENGDWEDDQEGYRKRMAAMRATLKRLEAEPTAAERVELVPTGQTYGEFWSGLEEHGKGAECVRLGIKVTIDPRAMGTPDTPDEPAQAELTVTRTDLLRIKELARKA